MRSLLLYHLLILLEVHSLRSLPLFIVRLYLKGGDLIANILNLLIHLAIVVYGIAEVEKVLRVELAEAIFVLSVIAVCDLQLQLLIDGGCFKAGVGLFLWRYFG